MKTCDKQACHYINCNSEKFRYIINLVLGDKLYHIYITKYNTVIKKPPHQKHFKDIKKYRWKDLRQYDHNFLMINNNNNTHLYKSWPFQLQAYEL